MEWGFGNGESEHEYSFGKATRSGELSPPEPKTPEPFYSPFRAWNPERSSDSNFPKNLGSVGQNLGSREGGRVPAQEFWALFYLGLHAVLTFVAVIVYVMCSINYFVHYLRLSFLQLDLDPKLYFARRQTCRHTASVTMDPMSQVNTSRA